MSKRIPLTQDKVAIVDDDDYDWLMQWKWRAHKSGNTYYAVRHSSCKLGKQRNIFMHREILGLTKGDGKKTDHQNHNGLDNQRCNLRICTHRQNHQNQRAERKGTSKYKGVSWKKDKKKWITQIRSNCRNYNLGYYRNEIKAAKAYDKKAKELFGEFACTNF